VNGEENETGNKKEYGRLLFLRGHWRIGKSSAVRYAVLQDIPEEENWTIYHIAGYGKLTLRTFLRKIVEQRLKRTEVGSDRYLLLLELLEKLEQQEKSESPNDDLRSRFQYLCLQEWNVVFLFECDGEREETRELQKVLRWLNKLQRYDPRPKWRFAIEVHSETAAREVAKKVPRESEGMLPPCRVWALDDDEVASLIRGDSGSEHFCLGDDCAFTLDELELEIKRWGGSHPWALQFVCNAVYNNHEMYTKSSSDDCVNKCIGEMHDALNETATILRSGDAESAIVDFQESPGQATAEPLWKYYGLVCNANTDNPQLIKLLEYPDANEQRDPPIGLFGVLPNSSNGQPVGVAFWVKQDLLVTCTHVVRTALGSDDIANEKVRLKSLSGEETEARVVYCEADENTRSENLSAEHEICVLRAESSHKCLDGLHEINLKGGRHTNIAVTAFGFPVLHPGGQWIPYHSKRELSIGGPLADGYAQLQGDVTDLVKPGISGSPLWPDPEQLDVIIGMVRSIHSFHEAQGQMIPADLITLFVEKAQNP